MQVDYADWLEIERRLKESSSSPNSAADMTDGEFEALAEGVAGHWKAGDGLEYQQRIRAEWDRRWEESDE